MTQSQSRKINMSIVINTNTAASAAAINLQNSEASLQKSLSRLSSGSKIVTPSDDPGGLAVSMKLQASINNTQAVQSNVANAISFLQTQDGSLQTAGNILNRMSQLATLYDDVTKSSSDKANYQTEFAQLQDQLKSIDQGTFNGVSLFGASGDTLSVAISADGSQKVTITKPYVADTSTGKTYNTVETSTAGLASGGISLGQITDAIQEIATFRAQNGAYTSQLNFASQILTTNEQNLESANSQIADVDVASESTNYAKYQILVQSGASMLAQANSQSQIALKLIGS
jgi:flagellin